VRRGAGGAGPGHPPPAAVLATTSIGVVAGAGYPLLALATAGIVLFLLELRFLPGLSMLDARRYRGSLAGDDDPPRPARRDRRRAAGA
jgi:hypothetical protein